MIGQTISHYTILAKLQKDLDMVSARQTARRAGSRGMHLANAGYLPKQPEIQGADVEMRSGPVEMES